MAVKLKDVERVLADGGLVRFRWNSCRVELISASGQVDIVDGRSYKGFLNKHQDGLNRVETGSTDNKDLVIEWRKI